MIVTDKIDTNEQIEAANSVNAPTVEDKSRDVSELVKTTFFFEMSFHNIGESRNAPGAEQNIETTANKKMLKVLKRLFVSPQYAKIKSEDAKLKRKINKLTVRGGLLTVRTIPKRHARAVIGMCAEHELTRNTLVDAFALVYPTLYENAKAELGPMFKSDEYPAPFKKDGSPDTESVKSAFKFTYNFVTYGVPEELKEFDGTGKPALKPATELDLLRGRLPLFHLVFMRVDSSVEGPAEHLDCAHDTSSCWWEAGGMTGVNLPRMP